MYTTISGIYENGRVILQESAPTEKSMKVFVVFVEENDQTFSSQTRKNKAVENELKKHFSQRWQGQFKLNDKTDDPRLDYLKHRYQL